VTTSVFPFAGLVIAHDVSPSDAARLAVLAGTLADVGASPVIVALAPDVDAPTGARVVHTRAHGSVIAAIRLGMAQLTNTVARAVLLVPARTGEPSLTALLALVDAAKLDAQALVALANASLDASPMLLPRDAWLELVTVGEGGMDAVAARRRTIRVAVEPG
jgi:hypothetical protein